MSAPLRRTASEDVLLGNIDGIFGSHLSGWFINVDSSEPATLALSIDGERVALISAEESRPDVQEHLGFGMNSGFFVDLAPYATERICRVSIVHPASGHDFFGAVMSYSMATVEHREALRSLFFPQYYRYRYELESLDNEEAFEHFITLGIYKDFNPNPWFDSDYVRAQHGDRVGEGQIPLICYIENELLLDMQPSSIFDPRFYVGEYKDLDTGMPLLSHYVNFGHKEGRRKVSHRLPDHIREEIDELVHIEPTLGGVKQDLDTVIRYPFVTGSTYLPRIIQRRYQQDIKIVICVPFVSLGGADLISTYLLKAYQKAFGEQHVLLVVTDSPTVDVLEWLPEGTRYFCMDNESSFIKPEEKVSTLHNIVGLLNPIKVVNVNSRACWDMYREYGMQLASVIDLNAYLFCFDYDDHGHPVGYIPDYIPELIQNLKCVFCDNRTVIDDMHRIYGFSDQDMKTFHTVYVPAPDDVEPRKIKSSRRADKILWVGRLARQKRPDVLVKIANAMPHIEFDVYGPPGDSPVSDSIVNGDYPNIRYRGVYSHLAELDTSRYALYLNTSEWEGLPTILIQMMSIGMPIITSVAGGICELVDESTGWIVPELEETDSFCVLINNVILKAEDTEVRVAAGRERIAERHTWDSFFDRLGEVGAFRHDTSPEQRKVVLFDRRSRSAGETEQAKLLTSDGIEESSDQELSDTNTVAAEHGVSGPSLG